MHLPPPLDAILPEVPGLLPATEPLATCERCAMARPASPQRPAFTASARCCTYHPKLVNFLVGRALRAGGPGADAIRRRLAEPDGVYPLGIEPPVDYQARWRDDPRKSFGSDAELTCPFWVEGELNCSIHADRDAVCRTWFCRVGRGGQGYDAWMAARDLVRSTERLVGEAVMHDPSDHDGDWERYYRACADRADDLDPAAFRTDRTRKLLDRLLAAAARRDQPMPPTPIPYVARWVVHDDRVELESWSVYDPVFVPPWIFVLFSKLDGQTHWRDAQRATADEIDAPVPPDLAWQLWTRGLLAHPDEAHAAEPRVDVIPQ